MEYKSKDTEYMRLLKKAILKGMAGFMPEAKQRMWSYIRKQVMMDDLVTYTIAKANELVTFPTNNFNGKIMVIFYNPPSIEVLEMLNKMIVASGIPKEEFYITWYAKVNSNKDHIVDLLHVIMESEHKIIDPEFIIKFGELSNAPKHTVVDCNGCQLIRTHYIEDILSHEGSNAEDIESLKRTVWNDMQQIIQLYKSH
jgi:hypothetical protein